MAISFDPVKDWVDVDDPLDPPSNARVIRATDLLRYENAIEEVVAAVNEGGSGGGGGSNITVDPTDPTILIISTSSDGSIAVDSNDPTILVITV